MQRANTITRRTQTQEEFMRSVKVALIKKGMSIGELAQELGLSRNTVSLAVNSGIYKPTQKKIKSFLNLFSSAKIGPSFCITNSRLNCSGAPG